MIAMSMTSVYEEYRRDRIAAPALYPVPSHPLRRAIVRVLAMIGLGVGGIATWDDEEMPGVG